MVLFVITENGDLLMKKSILIALSIFFLGQGSAMAAAPTGCTEATKNTACQSVPGTKCLFGYDAVTTQGWCLKPCKTDTDCGEGTCSPKDKGCHEKPSTLRI